MRGGKKPRGGNGRGGGDENEMEGKARVKKEGRKGGGGRGWRGMNYS